MTAARSRLAACAAIAVALAATAQADPPRNPGPSERIAYIADLLDAIEATDQAALSNTSNYLYAVERNKCQAPDETLHVGCVVAAARRNCTQREAAARAQCIRASDVIATNRLSEKTFVPSDVRYELVNRRDYRAALVRELHRRYAALVTELSMMDYFPGSAAGNPALAAAIERYCREASGTRELSWQYCVAAIVWFIAADGHTVAR